ncbi:hypothetical protein C8Q77DRAFT_1065309 [Trametes polyzona]|nr:hypothetical protein C8Q77DRAFT_1065309 [Trametes polyzona]
MSAPAKGRQMPSHVYVDGELQEHYTRKTLDGAYALIPCEVFWRDRQPFLLQHGFVLRARYQPNWRPSWLGTNLHPMYCEDSIIQMDWQVMDARRSDDNTLVVIKTLKRKTQELQILRLLSSIQDPQNHTISLLQTLDDPLDPRLLLIVMPYLRPCNDPPFGAVGEVIDFITQTLEGLVFMHKRRVAHRRDIAVENIMMDGSALYPGGHHPVRLDHTPDAIYTAVPLTRSERRVRYLYIDFGFSCHFPPGTSPYAVGDIGRDTEVPELSTTVPYDAFKVDIFALGNLYAKEFEEKYAGLQFLAPLIDAMKRLQPQARPPADQLLAQWMAIRDSLGQNTYRWRLSSKSEAPLGRMINDTVAVAWEGINNLKKKFV